LAALEHVHQLVAVGHHHRRAAVDDEVGRGDVLAEVLPQVGEHVPHGLELDARVQQLLDHLQLQQVPVGVAATAAGALRLRQRRSHQVGARPVVELAVRDADDLCGAAAAEALFVGLHVRDSEV
jgi:hypothetical protein